MCVDSKIKAFFKLSKCELEKNVASGKTAKVHRDTPSFSFPVCHSPPLPSLSPSIYSPLSLCCINTFSFPFGCTDFT